MEKISDKSQTLVVNIRGGGIAEYYLKKNGKRIDIVYGYQKEADFDGCMGDILSPFPGRVKDGKYQFEKKTYSLTGFELYEGKTPLHIFVREKNWNMVKKTKSSIRLEYTFDENRYKNQGYPFALKYSVEYLLTIKGLKVNIKVKNIGKRTVPFGVGFHPYVKIAANVNQILWQVPAKKLVEYGADLMPTGKLIDISKTNLDFRQSKKIGDLIVDNCFTDLIRDKKGIFTSIISDLGGKSKILIWQDKSFPYFQAYSSDTIKTKNCRKALALEPHSSSPFAVNIPKLGLIKLKPGQIFSGSWGISPDIEKVI